MAWWGMLSTDHVCPYCGRALAVHPREGAAAPFPFLCVTCRAIFPRDYLEYTATCRRCGGRMRRTAVAHCHECAAALLQVEIDKAFAAAVAEHRRQVESN